MLDYRNRRMVDGKRTANLDLQQFHALFERAIQLTVLCKKFFPIHRIFLLLYFCDAWGTQNQQYKGC